MYYIEVKHEGLKKYRFIQGSDKYVVEQKAVMLKEQWEELWAKRVEIDKKKAERDERLHLWNRGKEVAAEKTIEEVENILKHTLKVNDVINWDTLLNKSDYPKPKPSQPKLGKIPEEPKETDSAFVPRFSFLDKFLPWIEEKRIKEFHDLFVIKHAKWEKEKPLIEEENKKLMQKYEEELVTWQNEKEKYLKERDERNTKILEFKKKYLEKDLNVVLDYCEMVLANSKYPESFPQQYDLQNKRLLVDYFIPSKEDIPNLKEVKYNKSLDQFKETYLSESAFNSLYDKVLYEITLRTIHELYEADVIAAISSIVFNGYVKFFDKGTGKEVTSCILSIHAHRDEFLTINLENVDPKTCFKTLKGIGSSKLHGLAPIAPIMKLNKEDKRFVTPYAVADSIDEKTNIAAMDWKDFENLIRELFEKEFAPKGGEVKITRASRDEGVDAVVFDPDPLRGGKIIIQAKRYTNPVGLSAVRDLYGTIVNEGAIKGILVTTTDYGPDAYKFAQDKPITLLNGNNLLHMLEKHGHRAKIDIQEAKKILAEMEREEKTD
jgi:restriction system protein